MRIKESHRHWGARKLQIVYERSWGKAPSESSIKRVLERCGMVEKRCKQRAATPSGRLTSDVKISAPNDLWTVDFKGWWRLKNRANSATVGACYRCARMKEDGRKLSKEQQVGARRRAMLLLGMGWHECDIAEAVGVHERTVRQ